MSQRLFYVYYSSEGKTCQDMKATMPYFMQNKDWYYFDEADFCYKLTKNATPEAVQAYNEFYKDKNYIDENGKAWFIE